MTLPGVTGASMVLATIQQSSSGIAVASAVPGSGSFVITLTAVPKVPLKVAWFVLD